MRRACFQLIFYALLLGVLSPTAEASDPTEPHRWHLPRRGARNQAQEAPGPVHAEWNQLGQWVNTGKQQLADWGLRFDVDLTFFDQYANRVVAGRQNFGTFSWRVMGDWRVFDLSETDRSGIGKGFVGFTAFGTSGLGYDPAVESLTANVGAVNTLNATVFGYGAVLDELFWKQVAFGGKLQVLLGKLDQMYHFDTNRVANDGYAQFFSYSLQNNPSIPGPLFGGFGAVVRGNFSENTYAMLGAGDSSMDTAKLPWETLENKSWYQLLELGWSPEVPVLGKGSYRLTPWHNRLFGEDGFGVAFNFDQELGRKDLVGFFRFGYGDEDVTPVKTFVSGGVAFEGPFGREKDLAGIGVAWSKPSPGVGLRSETLLELFYRVEILKAVSITPDLQLVFDPANNLEDDVVVVPGVRLLIQF
jgi:carbohydrate-selective porin OprB